MTEGFKMFEAWCRATDSHPFPALPSTIASFVQQIGHLGIEKVLENVKAISEAHSAVADPTLGPVVQGAINEVDPIDPPRSWPKDQAAKFKALPYDMQRYVVRREAERDREVRRVQNKAINGEKRETKAA